MWKVECLVGGVVRVVEIYAERRLTRERQTSGRFGERTSTLAHDGGRVATTCSKVESCSLVGAYVRRRSGVACLRLTRGCIYGCARGRKCAREGPGSVRAQHARSTRYPRAIHGVDCGAGACALRAAVRCGRPRARCGLGPKRRRGAARSKRTCLTRARAARGEMTACSRSGASSTFLPRARPAAAAAACQAWTPSSALRLARRRARMLLRVARAVGGGRRACQWRGVFAMRDASDLLRRAESGGRRGTPAAFPRGQRQPRCAQACGREGVRPPSLRY